MGTAVRAISCQFQQQKPLVIPKQEEVVVVAKREWVVVPKLKSVTDNVNKIVLQPRLCTLRWFGSDRAGEVMIRTRTENNGTVGGDGEVSTFFAYLSEYIENSKKTQDFEIISGRLAMVVFASTVTLEIITGDSLFQKMDLQWIAQVAGACLGAVVFAAVFAWFSSNRTKVGPIFAVKCNAFIDSLIDNLIDGLFFESELGD